MRCVETSGSLVAVGVLRVVAKHGFTVLLVRKVVVIVSDSVRFIPRVGMEASDDLVEGVSGVLVEFVTVFGVIVHVFFAGGLVAVEFTEERDAGAFEGGLIAAETAECDVVVCPNRGPERFIRKGLRLAT